jgi:ubiquinone/menaquinone biosynthesis C-methylase UbiE
MDNSDSVIRDYYRQRAPVYDRVYGYPERQDDLRFLESHIPQQFSGKDVIEIAAGTGYWTQFIARSANSLVATDVTAEALSQIRRRSGLGELITCLVDAFELGSLDKTFSAAFAGLWVSHIPKQDLPRFFHSLHQCLQPGATVVVLDNSEAQCERLPISHTDDVGNTYQDRELDDGSSHRVLKNFPGESELGSALDSEGAECKFLQLEHFWLFQYRYIG